METGTAPWEMFMPVLRGYSDKRKDLIKVFLVLLDESMSGWCPKTSKFGGLPNYTFEVRKPVSLGTMSRDTVEVLPGVIMYLDPAMTREEQQVEVNQCGATEGTPSNDTINAGTASDSRRRRHWRSGGRLGRRIRVVWLGYDLPRDMGEVRSVLVLGCEK